jgi:hypothetical protein
VTKYHVTARPDLGQGGITFGFDTMIEQSCSRSAQRPERGQRSPVLAVKTVVLMSFLRATRGPGRGARPSGAPLGRRAGVCGGGPLVGRLKSKGPRMAGRHGEAGVYRAVPAGGAWVVETCPRPAVVSSSSQVGVLQLPRRRGLPGRGGLVPAHHHLPAPLRIRFARTLDLAADARGEFPRHGCDP